MAYEQSWSDWWRRFLGCSPDGYRVVVRILQKRYLEEIRHAKLYTRHAERMHYPQFREKLLRIASEEERHAAWIAQAVRWRFTNGTESGRHDNE